MKGQNHSALLRREKLLNLVEHAAHLLPMQGPIGVFIHHNTLHAFQHLPFERAVIDASRLFGAEPYMSEAAYRADLSRGRIQIDDINFVLASEPDAIVFPGLTRVRRRHDPVADRAGRPRSGLSPCRPPDAVRCLLRAHGYP